MPTDARVLSNRDLNRATLARQHLIERSAMPAEAMVVHLIAMQAQAPLAPYFGLWSRLDGFTPDDLSSGILDRSMIRIVTLRGTVHLHTANDALTIRGAMQPTLERSMRSAPGHKTLASIIPDLLAWGRELVEQEPRSTASLRPLLTERWPDADPEAMSRVINYTLPMVQVPPRGIWGASGQPVLTTIDAWTGRTLPPDPDLVVDGIILRYLAAFGPASVQDAQMWSGLTRLGDVFTRLRDRLITFRGDDGRELFDLPDAPRPNADTPTPVRILAPFDNVLLGYRERLRILPEGHQRLIFTKNGLIRPTVLVDGVAAGIASTSRMKDVARLDIDLFHPVSPAVREEIEAEGHRLLAFAEPAATSMQVEFTTRA
ncbi:MAG: winged helix DNA-binding domain-containing protein [Thermomicrobiales bacterium]